MSIDTVSASLRASSRFRALGEVPAAWSWLLALSGSFLAIGIAGLFAADLPPIHLKTAYEEPAVEELPLSDAPMAELVAMEEESEEPTESTDSVEIPTEFTEPPAPTPTELGLPDIADPLTAKDIFSVPAAPEIETALRPVEPESRPKPRPVSTTPRKSSSTSSSTASRSTSGSSSGRAGGSGATSGGTRRVIQSYPPYPSFAKSAGMQGTVGVSITFSPSGSVSSVRVTSTSGYTALDQYTADYVRRNYRASSHTSSSTYSKRFTFRLR